MAAMTLQKRGQERRFKPSPLPFDAHLVSEMRCRILAACDRLGTGHHAVLALFDRWALSGETLAAMRSWSEASLESWCRRVIATHPGEWREDCLP